MVVSKLNCVSERCRARFVCQTFYPSAQHKALFFTSFCPKCCSGSLFWSFYFYFIDVLFHWSMWGVLFVFTAAVMVTWTCRIFTCRYKWQIFLCNRVLNNVFPQHSCCKTIHFCTQKYTYYYMSVLVILSLL